MFVPIFLVLVIIPQSLRAMIVIRMPDDEEEKRSRNVSELEAGSVAYTVCQHFGIDTSEYSFSYVAGWYGSICREVRFDMYADDFEGNNSDLFLSEMNRGKKLAENSSLQIFKKIYNWISNHIVIVTPNSRVTDFKYYYENDSLALINDLIATFDTGISNVRIEEIDMNDLSKMLPKPILDAVVEKTVKRIAESDDKAVYMSGRIFDLMDMLLMKEDDVVHVVDELERSLHPKLTEHFMKLFAEHHKECKIQLIFTTHEECFAASMPIDTARFVLPTPSVLQNITFSDFSMNLNVIRTIIFDLSRDGWKLKSNSFISFMYGKFATLTQPLIDCSFLKLISSCVNTKNVYNRIEHDTQVSC